GRWLAPPARPFPRPATAPLARTASARSSSPHARSNTLVRSKVPPPKVTPKSPRGKVVPQEDGGLPPAPTLGQTRPTMAGYVGVRGCPRSPTSALAVGSLAVVFTVVLSCGCGRRDSRADSAASGEKIMTLKLTSSRFTHQGEIPSDFTCEGKDF